MLLQRRPAKMNADEIDDWYTEEQEKVFSKYLQAEDKKKATTEYKEEMKELREKYSERYEKALQPKRESKYSKIVKKIRAKLKKS